MSEISSQRQGKLHCVNAVTAVETGNQAHRAAGSTDAGCAWCVIITIIIIVVIIIITIMMIIIIII